MSDQDAEDPRQAVRDKMPVCRCQCGCEYRLMNERSRETLTCWSCRHGNHFGGTPLDKEKP